MGKRNENYEKKEVGKLLGKWVFFKIRLVIKFMKFMQN